MKRVFASRSFIKSRCWARSVCSTNEPREFVLSQPTRLGSLVAASSGEAISSLLVGRSHEGSTNVKEHYSFGDELGKGAFGKVLVAECLETGGKYACKSIPKALFSGEEHRDKRIRREVEVGLVLRGTPGVVALHETYEDGDYIHVLFELCRGENLLRSMLRTGPMSEEVAAALTAQMLRCVDQCHQLGVVHRDVKPSNFLWQLESDGSEMLKLADFGLSTFWRLKIEPKLKVQRQLIRTHTYWRALTDDVGTGSFAAPEVMDPNSSYGPRCDVWSVGAITYMAMFGRPPFFTKNLEEVRRRVQDEELDFAVEVNGTQLSSSAQNFLSITLQKEPNLRASVEAALNHPWIRWGEEVAVATAEGAQRALRN